ncbi:PREDICTED: uncharacterized protein LOC109183392 [Ipomoea nil]|uniref:uncharacterized protein LOC109183392 n=1 Tax=Ipomoea nil TaxID=35883 RepID=UPI0009019DBE|nr:PREDICTED: uncharacterized protein LOC109183392 [Ipomoea nil]
MAETQAPQRLKSGKSTSLWLPLLHLGLRPAILCHRVLQIVHLSGKHGSPREKGFQKRREDQFAESDPPVRQVFKNLRSSIKGKAPAVAPSTKVKKMKPITKPRGRSVTPDRSVDENLLNSVCDVLPLLREVGLLKTVKSVCDYSKLLTYEFYCNLNEEIDDLTSKWCMRIFIRGDWYVFGPDVINEYYGLKPVDEDEIIEWDLVAKTLTEGVVTEWPSIDTNALSSSEFTSKFVILHRIALHNWLPSAHFHTVSKTLVGLIFRVGTKMTVDLGKRIFSHMLTLIHPREQKVKLPYPNLICGVLTSKV